MAQIANSEITTSSIADFTSQEWKVKSIIQSEISRDETSLDDIIPELSSASEHAINFDAEEYLQAFYSIPTKDVAMQTILFFLPGILYWIPEKIRTLLDLGAGPTVYVPIIFRKHTKHIYSADCAETSCEMLKDWVENKSSFDWTEMCRWIACIENSNESPAMMEENARGRFKAVLRADVHTEPVIKCMHYKRSDNDYIPQQFHVVVTIFCLEYSSENLEGYRRAVRNAVNLIESNGFLIQGGVLQANDYYFGNKRYRCHYLTREQVIESLRENHMAVEEDGNFKWFEFNEVFLLVARKKA